jgi:hypothetical protein
MITQNALSPAAVRHAIVDLMTESLCGLSIASAYVTECGSMIVRQSAERYIAEAGLRTIPKLIITCFDFGLSGPDALRFWLQTPATVIRVLRCSLGARLSQRRRIIRKSIRSRPMCALLICLSAQQI